MVDDSGSDALLNNLADTATDRIKEIDEDVDQREAFLNKLLASAQWAARLNQNLCSSDQVKGYLE